MQRIVPCLWFDGRALEAAGYYASLFEGGESLRVARSTPAAADLSGVAAGEALGVRFRLAGTEFMALNGGPGHPPTPALSFFVRCADETQLRALWDGLVRGGGALMELNEYPFSPLYGWVRDRYGFTWQLSLDGGAQRVAPFLMFQQPGAAGRAAALYAGLLGGEPGAAGQPRGFSLCGQPFMAFDSPIRHDFGFTDAASLYLRCADQAEVDRLWAALTEGGKPMWRGWLRDRFGVTWQVVPEALDALWDAGDDAAMDRVMRAMGEMRKLNLDALMRAYRGA